MAYGNRLSLFDEDDDDRSQNWTAYDRLPLALLERGRVLTAWPRFPSANGTAGRQGARRRLGDAVVPSDQATVAAAIDQRSLLGRILSPKSSRDHRRKASQIASPIGLATATAGLSARSAQTAE